MRVADALTYIGTSHILTRKSYYMRLGGSDNIGERSKVLVLGEVLWDVFPDSELIGGAPLNFAAHVSRLGHPAAIVSAVGNDRLGKMARDVIGGLQLDSRFLQTSARFPTGTATVQLLPDGQPTFRISRPAAYDDVVLSEAMLEAVAGWRPQWLYYGTLFHTEERSRQTLRRLTRALPEVSKFYDVNLRPGTDSPALLSELLGLADVVKLNEDEMKVAATVSGLKGDHLERFCAEACARFGWRAVCVTLGSRGCAMQVGGDYVQADGVAVTVADAVGAGDAFAAGFLHGIERHWRPRDIATFANRIGALVASRNGAIPAWNIEEIDDPRQVPGGPVSC